MSNSLNQSRRPHISIFEYPEDLNPFKEDDSEKVELRKSQLPRNSDYNSSKEDKHKFWMFGKSKKKRSNSFSIKSKWSGIFGKRKDHDESERKPVTFEAPSTHRNTTCNSATAHYSTDQQEFNEALNTLTRRRKYTLDNSSSRYSSSLTVNGDTKRIYDGCPQNTTASIMGDLTPKPPIRRFGQINSKTSQEISSLNHEDSFYLDKNEQSTDFNTPIAPKRGGLRSSQKLNVPWDNDEHNLSIKNDMMIDENENMPEDYVFKRFNRSAVQKSNLSINSCTSIGSVYHSGRKKRRAPPPPPPPPPVDTSATSPQNIEEEVNIRTDRDTNENIKAIDIAKVTENIEEMTKQNQVLHDDSTSAILKKCKKEEGNINGIVTENDDDDDDDEDVVVQINPANNSELLNVELKKKEDECMRIVKEVNVIEDINDNVKMWKRSSLDNVSSSDSFCVKDEIEKIERQIQLLETNRIRSRTCSLTLDDSGEYDDDDSNNDNSSRLQRSASRRSLQEHRRNFFRDLTKNNKEDGVRIEIKELPRESNDIKIVRLSESPTPNLQTPLNKGAEKPVGVIELYISEPIKQKQEFSVLETEVNPIPKPRRHYAH